MSLFEVDNDDLSLLMMKYRDLYLKELTYYGIDIRNSVVHRKFAFNGSRGRKLRRL